jgi:hypothetical protein
MPNAVAIASSRLLWFAATDGIKLMIKHKPFFEGLTLL